MDINRISTEIATAFDLSTSRGMALCFEIKKALALIQRSTAQRCAEIIKTEYEMGDESFAVQAIKKEFSL